MQLDRLSFALCCVLTLVCVRPHNVTGDTTPAMFSPLPDLDRPAAIASGSDAGISGPDLESGGTEKVVDTAVKPASGEEALPAAEFFSGPPVADGGGGIVPADNYSDSRLIDQPMIDPDFSGSNDPGMFGSWFSTSSWDPWEGSVEFGLNGTNGNTETFNVRFGGKATHKTEWLEKTLQVTSIQKTAAGRTTANTALIDGRLDWPIKGYPWNYFIHGLTEYDQFKAFDYRFSADTGFGYELIDTERTKLVGRAGLAGSYEVGGPEDEFKPELLFGGEFKHNVNDTNKLSFKSDFYPAISDFGDFRVNSQASWELTLAREWGLSMKWSLIDRYDSTPQGARRNDLDYSTLLLWSF